MRVTILVLTFSSAAAALTSADWSVLSVGSVVPLSCMQTPKSTKIPLPPPSPEVNSASCVSFVEKIFVPRLRLLRTPGLGGGVGVGVGAVVGVGGGVGFGVGCGVGFRVGFGVGFGVGPFDAVGPGVGSEVACAVGCGVGKSVGAIVADTCGDFDTCTDTVPFTAAAIEAANVPLEFSIAEVNWLGSTLCIPAGN